jgi:hypothetical protein
VKAKLGLKEIITIIMNIPTNITIIMTLILTTIARAQLMHMPRD